MTEGLLARYEAAAPFWGARLAKLGFPAAYRAIMAEAVRRLPTPPGPLAAIDLGSGDGAFAEALAAVLGERLKLTLLDPSPGMLAAAEARLGSGRARLVRGDLDQAPLAEGGYDVVLAAHLLEHLPDPGAALARMAGLLQPGGLLILSVSRPHWCSRLVWLSWRHRRFREAEMRAMLHKAGFTDLHCWRPIAGPPRRLSLAYAARRSD
ncbi:MAG: class I SAM-dependent methyltransferase [Tabrizicola sp.]|jgi:ubiquinone/menaquinone biosynthesis C-methylase UbiE|nr:class I SAM-dependent methyltransferase [Tabrizicola sp.]